MPPGRHTPEMAVLATTNENGDVRSDIAVSDVADPNDHRAWLSHHPAHTAAVASRPSANGSHLTPRRRRVLNNSGSLSIPFL